MKTLMREAILTNKTFKECHSCKKWHDCLGKEWYSYSDIRWCRYQVQWILQNRELLLDGIWPPEGKDTGYVGGGRSNFNSEGRYVKSSVTLGEVEARLKEIEARIRGTGTDGTILLVEIENGKSWPNLRKESRNALAYVSGWKRKRMSYAKWLWQRNNKKDKTSLFEEKCG